MLEIVDDVRGFNRFYTRVLGLLRPDLAGSAFGLTEARVMFELAHSNGVSASDLRRELDLDAGYLSRILSTFTTAGLVVRERSEGDGRRQIVRLTDAGRRAFADLDRLQAEAINAMWAPWTSRNVRNSSHPWADSNARSAALGRDERGPSSTRAR